MVPVDLVRIIIDDRNHDQAVILRERGGEGRQVPIVIGYVEASSIQMKIAGIEPPRPLTHDLLAAVIDGLGAKAEQLLIDDLVDGTFFAKLQLRDCLKNVVALDCRPSDGIALAVRLGIPMFIEEKVFERTAPASDSP